MRLANPALSDLEFLVGGWAMAISRASFLPSPETVLHGRVEAVPIESGALLAWRQGPETGGPPRASWVIGRDGSQAHYTVLYSDDRGVSRVYLMRLTGTTWHLWRDDPEFAQRFLATVSPGRDTIAGRWEKCAAGGMWEHDFDLTYSRLPPAG